MSSPTVNSGSATAFAEAEKCARCGKCRAACPVFAELQDEAFVARGRIRLFEALRRNEVAASPELQKIMSACLMCQRCSEACPSGVQFMEVLRAARERLANELGYPLFASLVLRHVVPRRKLFDFALRGASLIQRIIPGKKQGHLRHLPLFFKGGKWLPPISTKSALRRHLSPERVADAKVRVALFVGCLTNYVYPEIVDACVELLRRAEIETVIPPSQLCCGTPAVALGDIDAARKLAQRNKESFESVTCDCIVTACASCGRMLKHEYPYLLGGKGQGLGVPVYDIAEFIHAKTALEFRRLDETVTYHDPCHLRWGQGIQAEPRELLARSCQFKEIPNDMYCCGQAGTFHVFYPEVAEMIGRRKVESLTELDSREVATGCPGCILQLNDLMTKAGMRKKALHTVEVLLRAVTNKGNQA
ncbi:MAG: (Fe-S)-binding protein [Candidatus Abyssobacteria bacterium SURF_17]|uniref:Glycolate oxidase iron-sulfur subunit n=1 Tax=Candidatus Abyssobacteria bacterium SURF_17 TaxID=2093361 RepID=A0A419ES17_9BACT|nr:MAG: (Fe-S)-binding protein [Candidatus Abyssubacteria bacterium SURF_17]